MSLTTFVDNQGPAGSTGAAGSNGSNGAAGVGTGDIAFDSGSIDSSSSSGLVTVLTWTPHALVGGGLNFMSGYIIGTTKSGSQFSEVHKIEMSVQQAYVGNALGSLNLVTSRVIGASISGAAASISGSTVVLTIQDQFGDPLVWRFRGQETYLAA